MKIALITDTHFGARNDNPAYANYFFKFYNNVFFPYLKEHNIKTCIHLGDIVDRRKFINFKTSHDFRHKFMRRLWEEKIDTHIIVGNHDTYYKNTNEVNAVDELLTTYDGINEPFIYSDPKVVEIGGMRMLFLPWVNSSNEEKTRTMLEQESADIVLGHLEIKGFEMHNNMKSVTGLDKKLFRRFEKVLSGHFHKKSDDGQIYYLGCPYEFMWNDYNCQKGFHILDTETRELERIVNPYTIHEKIYYNDEENDYKDFDYSKYEDKFIKLIVEKKKDYYLFDKFIDGFYKKTKVHDIKIIEDYSDLDASTVADDIAERSEDTPTLLDNYVNELETDLNKDKLKTLMRTLYTEAGDMEI
jgi:DNA repair exonuclease SbcCD nuclease subunit|tara:strand:+ start:36 stop:1106 length:1071 start_codon:yes stop_codon:yes gene_type:complete